MSLSPFSSFSPYRNKLKQLLSPERFQHCLGVAELAAQLAPQVNLKIQRAYLAGLLHDCARDLPKPRQEKLAKSYQGRFFRGSLGNFPGLRHNPAGVYLARRYFKIKDPMILRAIALHSTGIPGLLPLDKVIYVADYCEPHRSFPAAKRLRLLALKDLDAALLAVAEAKTWFLSKRGHTLHPYALALAKELGIKL